MRVLVCGGRDFNDWIYARGVLDKLHAETPITVVIHGACGDDADELKGPPSYRGADKWGDFWARLRGVLPVPQPAHWTTQGRPAGPRRNEAMLELKPDLVVAFPGGAGTASMCRLARKAGVRVVEVPPKSASCASEGEKR